MKQTFSSITAKLFLSFWLITIISIGATRFISNQFSNDTLIFPAHKGDLSHLYRMQSQIAYRQPGNIKQILNPPRQPPGRIILVKDMANDQVFSSSDKHSANLGNYLKKNTFNNIVSVQFPFARLTGPLPITVSEKKYQLYLASRNERRPFGMFFMQLPPWLRILIPLIVSFTFCWLLARSLTRPLVSIQKAAAQLGEGKLDTRVPIAKRRNDELSSLAKSFNTMAEKLEINHSAHKRLLADVSHELRSPMTRLQMAIGLAQKAANNPQDLTKHLLRCEKEVMTLDTMIADVLSLSRFENTLTSLITEHVDLKEILTLLIQDAQFVANEKSIRIKTQDMLSVELQADSQLLTSAFNNVLTNAVKYSERNSEIIVEVELHRSSVSVKVIDSGPGVPENSLENLFKPFYRVNDARDRYTGGTGLGLAIAKQAIEAHHGFISANNNKGCAGLTITVKLPLVP